MAPLSINNRAQPCHCLSGILWNFANHVQDSEGQETG